MKFVLNSSSYTRKIKETCPAITSLVVCLILHIPKYLLRKMKCVKWPAVEMLVCNQMYYKKSPHMKLPYWSWIIIQLTRNNGECWYEGTISSTTRNPCCPLSSPRESNLHNILCYTDIVWESKWFLSTMTFIFNIKILPN